jgi:hypothetical protein
MGNLATKYEAMQPPMDPLCPRGQPVQAGHLECGIQPVSGCHGASDGPRTLQGLGPKVAAVRSGSLGSRFGGANSPISGGYSFESSRTSMLGSTKLAF